MKKYIISLLCIAATTGAYAQDKKEVDNEAGKFSFVEETHDYGTVPEGPVADCDFVFTNTGKRPIVITNAQGSCGCTVPEWPRQPIKPGEKGTIHVKYTTQGHQGPISKEVTITSDAQQSTTVLHIRGTVSPKPAEPAPATTAVEQ